MILLNYRAETIFLLMRHSNREYDFSQDVNCWKISNRNTKYKKPITASNKSKTILTKYSLKKLRQILQHLKIKESQLLMSKTECKSNTAKSSLSFNLATTHIGVSIRSRVLFFVRHQLRRDRVLLRQPQPRQRHPEGGLSKPRHRNLASTSWRVRRRRRLWRFVTTVIVGVVSCFGVLFCRRHCSVIIIS